jgi:1-acyl-sn-glycerol-3-phosphate acyltransferase
LNSLRTLRALILNSSRILRALWRVSACVFYTLQGALICGAIFPFRTKAQRMHIVGQWSRRMLRALGLTLTTSGSANTAGTLFVANHVSWIDILAVDSVQPARFVSKADVRHWPLIGWLVACGGTLFIERERKRDALRVVHLVAEALKDGELVAVFPEGTTSTGHALLPFHANLLQAAISSQAPVQPIALRYSDDHHAFSEAVAFVGDTTIARSLWWVVMADNLRVHVNLLPPVASAGLDRRALSDQLHSSIQTALV